MLGSAFKLKIKVVRFLTYNELKSKKYNEVNQLTYKQLKGE